jgi:tetratricopeptide (TPR) repeat protein
VHLVSGRLEPAEEDLGRALAIGRAGKEIGLQALVLHALALRRSWQGEYQASLQLANEVVEVAREHRLVVPLIRSLWNTGLAWTDLGDYDSALAALSEGLALAEKVGDDAQIPRVRNTLGWLRIDCGDLASGIELSERSYEETNSSSRAGHGTGAERRAFVRVNEGDAWMAQGDFASAARALEEALHTVQHPPPSRWMTWRYSAHCYASLAQLALLKGDPERARRLADQCLETAVPTHSRKYESWAWRIKGESATACRAWGEAEDALGRARALAEMIGQPRQIWMSHLALGRLDAAQGRRQDALAAYRAAWSIIVGLRERTHDAALRAGLESLPLIRELEDLARPE